MPKVIQNIPTFPDAVRKEEEYSNLEDLLAIPWVQLWKSFPTFEKYSLSDDCLIVELNGGFEWWVIAYLEDTSNINLPEWDFGKYKIIRNGQLEVVSGYDVIDLRLGYATLKSGETCQIAS